MHAEKPVGNSVNRRYDEHELSEQQIHQFFWEFLPGVVKLSSKKIEEDAKSILQT